MDFTKNLDINIYSIVLLIIIFIHSLKNNEKGYLTYKLYMMLLQITFLMLCLDIFSRFDGNPGTIYTSINHIGNFFIFLLSPIIPSLWLLYAHAQIFHEDKKTKRLIYPLIAANAVNAVIVVLTQFFGWYYYIDSNNIYHRGPLFLLSASVTVVLVLSAFVMIIKNRKIIEKKYYFSLLFFAIPPSVCIILQIIFYGTSLMLNSVVLSLLIVFLKIQNQNMYIDFLTEVYNRKKLEIYLKDKINASTEKKTFSVIMIDLNDFKSINDTFGHDMGDCALQNFSKLLKSCLGPNDFIARFGGDEFCIVPDVPDETALNDIVCRINDNIDKHNKTGDQPYQFGFGIGYAVYDYNSLMSAEEFQKHVDLLMYENKRASKEYKFLSF